MKAFEFEMTSQRKGEQVQKIAQGVASGVMTWEFLKALKGFCAFTTSVVGDPITLDVLINMGTGTQKSTRFVDTDETEYNFWCERIN